VVGVLGATVSDKSYQPWFLDNSVVAVAAWSYTKGTALLRQELAALLDEKKPVTALDAPDWHITYTKFESLGAQATSIRENEPLGVTLLQLEVANVYFQT
jgi:hypothetical protein